jgi:hypothetical protein
MLDKCVRIGRVLTTSQTASGSGALRGIGDRLRAKRKYAVASFLRWFLQSKLRLLALEIRSVFPRIAACLTIPLLQYGNTLYEPSLGSMGSPEDENRYTRACMAHIQELRREYPWASPVDVELAAQSHQAGAIWALRNFGKGTRDTEHVQPLEPLQR